MMHDSNTKIIWKIHEIWGGIFIDFEIQDHNCIKGTTLQVRDLQRGVGYEIIFLYYVHSGTLPQYFTQSGEFGWDKIENYLKWII